MSSKQQPIYPQITRSNYEEQFLLYVDGELSPEAMDAVDAFTALHPDLHEELQHLLDTRLEAEPISLGDTSFLLADQMKASSREEELLSYIDNELDGASRASLQAELLLNEDLRAQLALLSLAKLDASEKILFPYKEELYRREEKRRPALAWWRVAAVVLLLGAGTILWQNNSGTTGTSVDDGAKAGSMAGLMKISPAQQVQPGPADVLVATTGVRAAAKSSRVALPDFNGNKQPKKTTPAVQHTATQPSNDIAYNPKPDPRDRTALVASHDPVETGSASRVESVIASTDPVSKKLATDAVTIKAIPAFNPQNTALEATTAVVRNPEASGDRQTSVRGLLRKASRFLEKRTGIRTTNEENQLVLGGVAINLK